MDASCKIQGSIHSFRLVYNMCPELWVHIIFGGAFFILNRHFIIESIKRSGNKKKTQLKLSLGRMGSERLELPTTWV